MIWQTSAINNCNLILPVAINVFTMICKIFKLYHCQSLFWFPKFKLPVYFGHQFKDNVPHFVLFNSLTTFVWDWWQLYDFTQFQSIILYALTQLDLVRVSNLNRNLHDSTSLVTWLWWLQTKLVDSTKVPVIVSIIIIVIIMMIIMIRELRI